MKHEWRILLQYKLTDDEAKHLVLGYGHPEFDNAPDRTLATGERPEPGDPRVFLGTHNVLRDELVVVCWNCELAWDVDLASRPCSGHSEVFPDLPPLSASPPLGNVTAGLGSVGRNDPCPCGSGKKFKRCHGAEY